LKPKTDNIVNNKKMTLIAISCLITYFLIIVLIGLAAGTPTHKRCLVLSERIIEKGGQQYISLQDVKTGENFLAINNKSVTWKKGDVVKVELWTTDAYLHGVNEREYRLSK